MRFIEVKKEDIPRKAKKAESHNCEAEIREFLSMNTEAVKVIIGRSEFKNSMSAHQALNNAVKRYQAPIRVVSVDNDIYLIRKDI